MPRFLVERTTLEWLEVEAEDSDAALADAEDRADSDWSVTEQYCEVESSDDDEDDDG